MRNFTFFITFLSLTFLFGCNDVSSKKNPLKNTLINGQDPIVAKDLSKLTAEEVIKTKFKNLQLVCSYVIEASAVKDGGVTSETKNGIYLWDIVNNTIFNKNILINDKVLNLTFNFSGAVILSLDTKFNVSIKATDKYGIKTFADDGKILTSIDTDNSNNPFSLQQSQSVNLIEMSEGPSGSTIGNKIKMDCSLKTDIYPIYKN